MVPGCVRIVNSGQRYVPVLLTLLHKTEGHLLVLPTFSNLGSCFYCICGHSFRRKGDLTWHQSVTSSG